MSPLLNHAIRLMSVISAVAALVTVVESPYLGRLVRSLRRRISSARNSANSIDSLSQRQTFAFVKRLAKIVEAEDPQVILSLRGDAEVIRALVLNEFPSAGISLYTIPMVSRTWLRNNENHSFVGKRVLIPLDDKGVFVLFIPDAELRRHQGQRCLILDDIHKSGRIIQCLFEAVQELNVFSEITYFTLIDCPSPSSNKSYIDPTYDAIYKSDAYEVDFFWHKGARRGLLSRLLYVIKRF